MSALAGVLESVQSAAVAGLPWPEGDPGALHAAAKQAGAAGGLLTDLAGSVATKASAISGWEGDAASAFRTAVSNEQQAVRQPVHALQTAAGALDRLGHVLEAAQTKIVKLAREVTDAEDAASRAEATATLAATASAGASALVDLAGAHPPPALTSTAHDAHGAATAAGRSATAARAHARAVRVHAERTAGQLCADVRREDAATAGAIDAVGVPYTSGGVCGAPPGGVFAQDVSARMTVQDWKELAFLRAGIDPTRWRPELGLDANNAIVRSVYARYQELGLSRPEFEWMKLAAVGAPVFYAGFQDLSTLRHVAEGARDDPGVKFTNPAAAALGGLGAPELKWYETTFLKMQKAIFTDLAWQHEAYALGGVAAIRHAARTESVNLPLRRSVVQPWEDIGSGDPVRVRNGNFALVKREQGFVIQGYYDKMFDRHGPEGAAATYGMTYEARSPLPGGDHYADFSHPRIPLLPDPRGIPVGNIAHYGDRMNWIREDLWPSYQRFLHTPGAVQANLAMPFDDRVERFRVVPLGPGG